ncbi:uncharacterized protein LOC120440540 [Oreochromis aureus]|uniref:uncharacterized protein LOC120440540 n=1 Tax=Oreochromis aureus TaxID=47969 RepID=UPI0019546F0B|nr:uncharacterized protein LOC120440540 [Oreochromis aureus]
MNWYSVHRGGFKIETSADGKYSMSAESNLTLTVNNLAENDANIYCCREPADKSDCGQRGISLSVAELQVKVIPATEGQTVTLMCSSSCPLTEKPAAYIWYKNREFLYEDWSPWYQELLSSEEAVTYSCAVKGYEDLRAPEVSVDFITSACFSVTYAKREMCRYEQASEDEPYSITFPREVYIVRTSGNTLTCSSLCPLTDPQTVYVWYENGKPFRENQHLNNEHSRVEYHDNVKNQHILTIKNLKKNDSGEYTFILKGNDKELKLPGVFLIVTAESEDESFCSGDRGSESHTDLQYQLSSD